MRAEFTVGVTGMSVLLQDPTYAGFAPEAQLSALLSFTGIGCLAVLTLWSERWKRQAAKPPRARKPRERFELPDEVENAVHSTAI